MIAGFARLPLCALGLLALLPLSSCDRSPASPASPQTNTPIVTPAVVTLSSIAVSTAAVDGGIAVEGTVTLSAAAPSGGTVVTLTSNNAAASVPASITIASGAATGTFSVSTVAVTVDTDVTISGAAGGVTRTASLRIGAPTPPTGGPIASFTATHDDVIGGQNSSGTVTLSTPAPAGGVRLSLESDDRDVTVPAILTFAAGAISASFTINTAPVTVAKDVRLTATFMPAALRPAATAAGSVVFVLRLLPVAGPPPAVVTLTGVSPDVVVRGNVVDVQLTGTNFQNGATVQINGASILITNVIVDSATSMRARFFIDGDAVPGARTITVTSAAGVSGGQAFTLLMQGPQPPPGPPLTPTLTGMSPASAERNQGAGVTLMGTSFTHGMTVQITAPSSMVYPDSVRVTSTTSLTVIFFVDSDAPPGPRTVTVTTPGGTSNGAVFTVLLNGPPPPPGPALPPTLTAVTPASGVRGAGHGVRLTGTNFVFGATVAATGILDVSNVIVESTTSIVATLSSSALAVPGPHTLTVTTPAGTSGGQTFTVLLNFAPIAVGDAYTTSRNTVLNVAAPGVLLNDTDADGNTITASVITAPAHGTLTLSANGAFQYTPALDYVGLDSFEYGVNDGFVNGNIGNVTITVNAAPEPSFLLASFLSAGITAPRGSRARIRF